MAVPNLAPNYLGQVKGIRAQRQENEKQRAFESDQASKNFLRRLGGDVLGTALGIGADLAGTAFRDSLTRDERAAAAGTFYPDDTDVTSQIRQVAESRAATELRPQASFGEAAETGFGRRGIETAAPSLGGVKAQVLKPPAVTPPGPAPARPPSNPMLTPGLEAQFGRVTSAPVAPSPIAPRDMEAEAPRRPVSPAPSPMAQRPAPMPPRETREAPGGYQPPRMMPSTTAAMARESGYRESIPSLPVGVRGLAQQAQDVRDERALGLELMRKKLLWDEQQAAANVASLQARGASATAIAQARQQEADAKAKAEEMRQLDLLMSARSRGAPKYVRGLGVYTPPQTVLPSGNTDDGLRGDIVPQGAMGRQGGGGRGGGAARGGEEPTGDTLTIVRQNRDRSGKETGPSQPLRVQEGPSLWRAIASSPVDYGMNAEQSAVYKDAYRAFNAALPAARKGDAGALDAAMKAQDAMRSALMAGQSQYAPAVAGTREGFGTSQRDDELARVRDEQAALRRQVEEQGRARGQARIAGSAISDTAPLALPAEVTLDEVADVVAQDAGVVPADRGRFQSTQTDGELERAEYEAALRGAPEPPGLDAASSDLYRQVAQRAKDAKTRLLSQKEALREKRLRAIATELSAETDDPVGYLESLGVAVPQSLKPAPLPAGNRPVAPRPAAPVPRAAPAPAAAPSMPRFNSLDQAAEWVAKQPISPAEKSALLERIEDTQGLQ
jgi:hypothetical protein